MGGGNLIAGPAQKTFFEPSFNEHITHRAVVMSAITSCTNKGNPSQIIQAGVQ